MDWITDPQAWIALATLTLLEIVLGIDNIVFISILAGKLPPEEREKARRLGLLMALGGRILLLLSLSAIMRLTSDLFSIQGQGISGRDLILILGGLFLLAKATREIHEKIEGGGEAATTKASSFRNVLVQILILDLVFSLDSVITAVGMAEHLGVMITAVVLAVGVMIVSASKVAGFIETHPTVQMLALAFLLLVGVALLAEGLDFHIPRGYVYFAMAFSILTEMLNLRVRAKNNP